MPTFDHEFHFPAGGLVDGLRARHPALTETLRRALEAGREERQRILHEWPAAPPITGMGGMVRIGDGPPQPLADYEFHARSPHESPPAFDLPSGARIEAVAVTAFQPAAEAMARFAASLDAMALPPVALDGSPPTSEEWDRRTRDEFRVTAEMVRRLYGSRAVRLPAPIQHAEAFALQGEYMAWRQARQLEPSARFRRQARRFYRRLAAYCRERGFPALGAFRSGLGCR